MKDRCVSARDRGIVALVVVVLALVLAHVVMIIAEAPREGPMPPMVQSISGEDALPPVGVPRPVPVKLIRTQIKSGTLSDDEARYYHEVTP